MDTLFVKNLYYPEFLNKMLNIRDYLYYFFTKKSMLKSGNCLSNFNIFKIQKIYINKIYNCYYLTLRKYTGKISGVTKTVLKDRLFKKRLINDLQNADLFSFLFIYYFFELFVKKSNKKNLNKNIFLKNINNFYFSKLLKRYISYIFFKLKFSSVRKSKNKFLFSFNKKRKLLKKLKSIEFKKRNNLIMGFYKSKMN